MEDVIYGIDFGGSNLRIGKVDPKTGNLIGSPFVQPLYHVTSSEQLTKIIISKIPQNSSIGISAAGDVDERDLVIKFSPNSPIKEPIDFAEELNKDCEIIITNDMRAAVQAAARFGEGRGLENVLLATYSSGFNCAVVRKGENVTRAEVGHQQYGPRKGGLVCGCGGVGHLESYVTGNGAGQMAAQYFFATHTTDHPILRFSLEDYNEHVEKGKMKGKKYPLGDIQKNPLVRNLAISLITSKHVYQAFKENADGEPQKWIRDVQIEAIADSFGVMNSAYNPLDVMVLMGPQTKDWDILFVPAIERYHKEKLQLPSLPKPNIVKTELPEIGIQGAAAYFLSQNGS